MDRVAIGGQILLVPPVAEVAVVDTTAEVAEDTVMTAVGAVAV